VLDYGFDAQRQPFLTMELLENAPTLIEAGRNQPRDQQVALLIQLLQAWPTSTGGVSSTVT
jgi:hypothetical protein